MNKWASYASVPILVLLAGLIFWVGTGFPCLYAGFLEENWRAAGPKTKDDLESYLHLYSEHVIDPKLSGWGRNRVLGPDERMVQYLILWSQPLDVVYDDQDKIKVIYTSYE